MSLPWLALGVPVVLTLSGGNSVGVFGAGSGARGAGGGVDGDGVQGGRIEDGRALMGKLRR
ncbi:hypothetical protein [Streptomyces sp. ICC1]|uniref:hypothetical protein n=1 Tax=Streptomyces sp. ICC1 TaxID=2099583 RepID=UPI000DC7DEBF|nr:hypothetical protein [Streptomyces sp. ICC1]AWZ13248.1 hypothetical protein DRB96_14020 [Streptomyces sp. ICC1]